MSMIGYYFAADDDMVRKMQEGASGEFIFSKENKDSLMSVDKAWHAIHYILTGEVWEVPEDNILANLVLGGEPVNDEDTGYGPVRFLDKEIVTQIADAVDVWDETAFRDKFDIKDMAEKQVYPVMDDEDGEIFFRYVWESFAALKQFFKETAQKGLNMLLFLA